MNIIVITGASSGLGREFALQLNQMRYEADEIWLIARREERLIELSEKLTYHCELLPFDLATQEGFEKYTDLLKAKTPVIKMLINCAGFGFVGRFDEISLQEQSAMIDLNCKALTQMTYSSIPYMKKNSRIIQLASSASFMPQPGFAVYAATKAYVLSFSRALSEELRKQKIIVTAVCPGPIRTEFFDLAEKYGKKFTFKKYTMVDAPDVVKSALKAAFNKKSVSVYSILMKLFRVTAKIVPHKIILFFLRLLK